MLITREGFSRLASARKRGRQLAKKKVSKIVNRSSLPNYARLGQAKDTNDIQVHDLLKGGIWIFIKRGTPCRAGIVDQDVQICWRGHEHMSRFIWLCYWRVSCFDNSCTNFLMSSSFCKSAGRAMQVPGPRAVNLAATCSFVCLYPVLLCSFNKKQLTSLQAFADRLVM